MPRHFVVITIGSNSKPSHLKQPIQISVCISSKNKQGQYMQFLTYNCKKTLQAHQQVPETVVERVCNYDSMLLCYANSLMFYVL
jgi:hypothetical protein